VEGGTKYEENTESETETFVTVVAEEEDWMAVKNEPTSTKTATIAAYLNL
jgi:hypothetical protein